MTYAIIRVGGKQHRVREGEWLLVDRLPVEEGKTFQPDVLLIGGDGEALLGDDLSGKQVTARVTEHVLGPKLVIGKHRRRTGYRRRNGFRARLSKIEIESIGAKRASRSRKTTAAAAPAGEGVPEEKPKRTRRTTKKTDGE
jgi:large subunit ribosomal protein L21